MSTYIPTKTQLGVDELRNRTRRLSQRHRTVLLMADGARTLDVVLTMAQQAGASSAHFDELVALGLIEGPPPAVEPVEQDVAEVADVPSRAPEARPTEAVPDVGEVAEQADLTAAEKVEEIEEVEEVAEIQKPDEVTGQSNQPEAKAESTEVLEAAHLDAPEVASDAPEQVQPAAEAVNELESWERTVRLPAHIPGAPQPGIANEPEAASPSPAPRRIAPSIRRRRLSTPESAPEAVDPEAMLAEVRRLLIDTLRLDAPVFGARILLRVRSAEKLSELIEVVWDIERHLSHVRRSRSELQSLQRARELLGLGNTLAVDPNDPDREGD